MVQVIKNKKLTIVAVLIAAVVFFGQISCTVSEDIANQFGGKTILVENQFGGAQRWFDCMAKKYPMAKLENVSFCVGDCSKAENGKIFFPVDVLECLDSAFGYKKSLEISDPSLERFVLYEWILLHEACHVLSKDDKTIDRALFATVAMCVAGCFLGPVGGIAAAGACAGGVQILSHKHEYRADAFANEHACTKALIAVIAYFEKLKSTPNDLAHPDPKIRQENTQKALQERSLK